MRSAVEPLKARRIYLLLRDRIIAGDLPPGTRLPGEPALAAEHAVSRVTVRRALDLLDKEGLVQRKAGSGTFVHDTRSVRPIVADLSNVLSHLIDMGRSTDVKLLSFGYGLPSEGIAESLGMKPGERVQRSVRVRLIDGVPFSYLTTHVPEWIGLTYSEAELAARPLLELIERSGVTTERATQAINATLAGPEAAAALDLEIGSPLLTLTRVVYEPAGRGVEHLHALYRPDRYSFHMDLVRTGNDGERRWSPALGWPRASDKGKADKTKPEKNKQGDKPTRAKRTTKQRS
ncbi:GntR family transcriptional regulator [Azospirillum sp. TSO35-2]|uniref:GntR family transcriptional regulator n=1 Tax=Azospirillum sp. TSO35-2 TaxID=716796 RepID=UPI000D6044DC|nr:GntR family transcriptional regulator [Azospirillum sp. TSO35-2]PWC37768.1 GntR family transcriptional regulator [Azospirillum sp. TSO35-2]